MRITVIDSGLGGLSICAALDRGLRAAATARTLAHLARDGRIDLTYVNAWPEQGRGYNDYPDIAARAAVFDRVLARIASPSPDYLVIACNTLSILYPMTPFSRTARFPVHGIVEAGVDVFAEALAREPGSSIVLLGTRTTIASDTHRGRLAAAGVAGDRLAAVACHGLAGAIERDPAGPAVDALLAGCARDVVAARPSGTPVFAGLCCTHYGYAADRIADALSRALGRSVVALDPNRRMVDHLWRSWNLAGDAAGSSRAPDSPSGRRTTPVAVPDGVAEPTPPVTVTVVSKVALDDVARDGIARLIEPVSLATSAALRAYRHVPDFF